MGRKIGAVFSFVTIIVEIFSALFLTPLIIRSFGQEEYGVYTLVLSVTSYLALLDLGVGNSVVRFMSKYRANKQYDEQRKFLGITTVYYVVIAIIVVVLGIVLNVLFPQIFAKGLNHEEIVLGQRLLSITSLSVALTIGTAGYFYTVVAHENFYVSKGVAVIAAVVRVIISMIALMLGVGSIGIALINTITTLVSRSVIVLFVTFKIKLIPTLKKVDFSQIKEIVSYSVIILLQMIATQINNMADQILIGTLTAASSVFLAVYGVGSQINHYFQTFGAAVNGVLMPGVVRMVEKDASPKELQKEMVRIGRLNFAFVGLIWTVFLVFGKQFVELWSGRENLDAYVIALLLMFPMIFVLTQGIGSQILWAKNKHKIQAILKFIIVLLNVVLTVALVVWDPLLGATIGTFISLMVGDVLVMQIVFKKELGIKLIPYYSELFRGILPSLTLSAIVGGLFRLLSLNGWLGFTINCFVMALVYTICILLFGFNKTEKTQAGKILNKILKTRSKRDVTIQG